MRYFLFVLLLFHLTLSAQETLPKPYQLGVIEEITSAKSGEKRVLNIYLPEAYHPDSTQTYPVLYLLDGSHDEDFVHIVGLVQFFTMIRSMPPTIVTGIANIDRKRDFTFPTTIEEDKKNFPTTGGSSQFIDFLETELQPFIQSKYKTSGHNTLLGQSLGGLLATEILLKRPRLFDQYLIISPSLWWDNESLLKSAPSLLAKHSNIEAKVYVSVGKEGKIMKKDAKNLYKTLKQSGGQNLRTSFLYLPKENHATILHQSVYEGFRILNTL